MTTNTVQEKKEILQLVERMQESWNRRDARAFAKSFAEDAEFTTVFGTVDKGRTAIEKGHALVFSRLFKNSILTLTGTSIRFIKPSVVSVDIRWKMTGATQPDGTPWKERKGLLTWIVVYQNQRWEIVVSHNIEPLEFLSGLQSILEKNG
ncbi:MAG: SgcJ/EcaC family oxidoreductase [Flavisolibacter sp.]